MYVDASQADVLFQQGLPERFAAEVGQAREEGRDVQIPLDVYLTDIVGTDLQAQIEPHIRLDPDAMTEHELANDDIEAHIQALLDDTQESQTVYDDVLGQLIGSGRDRSTAESYARLHEKFFATLAARTGRTADELYAQYGLRINREIDGRIAERLKEVDELDVLLDRLRAGDVPSSKDIFGQSLIEFIVAEGGVNDRDGEIANMDADVGRVGKNRIARPEGLSLDDMAERLVEAGYFTERNTDLVTEAIRSELAGEPLYAMGQENIDLASVDRGLDVVQQLLDEAGIDVAALSNEDIKAALKSVDSSALLQPAFHGSPHTFDEFSLQKIGTGEGAQAYGYGLYFSSKKEIAEYYRDALTDPDQMPLTLNGKPADLVYLGEIQERFPELYEGLSESQSESMDEVLGNLFQVNNISDYDRGVVPGLSPQAKSLYEQRVKPNLADPSPNQGRLYEVEIPEQSEMLDWDKPLSEQPESVQKALAQLPDPLLRERLRGKTNVGTELTGSEIYDEIQRYFAPSRSNILDGGSATEGAQDASMELGALGIPGITYAGATSGERNFVVWDDSLIKVQRRYQDRKNPKGYFSPSTRTITLTENADLSTFLHESAHYFLEVMRDVAQIDPAIQSDLGKLEAWFAENNAKDDRQKHEMFASGFETYLAEGKAPTSELQELFSRFKSWLVMVYRSIDNIFARNDLKGVHLSDEVRGVMDRLVASEDAIEAAKQEHQYGPLPVQQMGMNAEEARRYQELVSAADEEANTALTVEVMRELHRERQAEFKKALKAKIAEVSEDLDNQPAYIARDFLSGDRLIEDVEPVKLNRAFIRDMYGVTAARKLGRMSDKDGVNPDFAATMLGFQSGDEMVKALLGTMNKSDRAKYVEAQAKEQVHLDQGDVALDGTITERAQEIVHNEKQADRLLMEMRWLNRAAGQQETPRQYFKAAAERSVAATPVFQLRPDRHRRYEIKARSEAIKAAAEGDFKKAAIEQHKALRQFYLYRESAKAKAEADKIGEYGRSFKGKKLGRIRAAGDTYYEQIVSLLHKFEFSPVSNKMIMRRASMQDWITKTLEAAGEGNPFRNHEVMSEDERALAAQQAIEDTQAARPNLGITDQMLADAGTVNYRQLTLSGLRAVQDSLKAVEHLARLKNKLLTNADKRTLDEWTNDLVKSIEENTVGGKAKEFGSTRPRWDEAKLSLKAFKDISRTPTSLVRMLDGYKDGGAAWDLLMRPLQEAAAQETEQMEQANVALKKIFSRYSNRELGRMNRFTFDERLRANITKHDAISILLNWGNDGNRQRVLDGFGLSQADAQYIMDTYLEEKDYAFVKDVWAYLETFKEASFDLHRDLFGFTPDEVEPVPFETKYGTMPGGYYPIKYDSKKSAAAERQQVSKEGESFVQSLAAKKKLGSNLARQAKVERQIDTDMTKVIFAHVSDVVHQTTHDRALYDAGRVLSRDSVKKAITENYGDHVYKQLTTALRYIKDGTEQVVDIQDKIAMAIRNNATLAMLGASIRTVILQPFGITNSFAKARLSGIGSGGLVKGYARYMADPAGSVKAIREESLYMKNREQTQTVAISRIKNKIANKGKVDVIKEATMIPLIKMQFYSVDAPLYMAARDHFLDQGMSREKAIELAEQAVRDAQGGGNIVDTAQAMQGGPYRKLFTNFLTYMITTYNLQAENYQRTFKTKEQNAFDFAVNTFLLMTMPAILTALLNDWIAGDDDDEDLPERIVREQASFMLSMNPMTAQVSGAPTGFDYSGPQGTAIAGKIGSLVTQAEQGEVDVPLIRNGIWVVGLATGLPAAQINRTVFGIKDAVEKDKSLPKLVKQAAFGPER